jgi:hypothetical protein
MNLAQNRDQWRDVVNAIMNVGVPITGGEFLDYLSANLFLEKVSVSLR